MGVRIIRAFVWMVLLREALESAVDLLRGGIRTDAEKQSCRADIHERFPPAIRLFWALANGAALRSR
jgi:hypothetical protein